MLIDLIEIIGVLACGLGIAAWTFYQIFNAQDQNNKE